MDDRVKRALEFMEAHLHEPLTLTAIGRNAGISRDHLERLFHRETGMGPMKKLKVMRLRAAKRLLCSTHLSLKQIAAQVGFTDDDLSHFERDFTAFAGLAPGRYRKASLRESPERRIPPAGVQGGAMRFKLTEPQKPIFAI